MISVGKIIKVPHSIHWVRFASGNVLLFFHLGNALVFATWEGLQCLLSEPALHPNVSTADAFDQHQQTLPQPDPLPLSVCLPCLAPLISLKCFQVSWWMVQQLWWWWRQLGEWIWFWLWACKLLQPPPAGAWIRQEIEPGILPSVLKITRTTLEVRSDIYV